MTPSEVPLRRRRVFGLCGYGVATFFAFPHPVPGTARVVDLGLVAAPLAVAFLLLALEGLSRRAAVRVAFLASLAAHACLFHWFYVVTVVHGGVHPALGIFTPFVPSLYVACSTALFALAWRTLWQRGWRSAFAVAALWTSIDLLRSFALGGFPWGTLAYGHWQNAWLLGLAPLTGVYGIGFALALLGAALARLALDRRLSGSAFAALATVLLLHGAGALLAARPGPEPGDHQRVRVAGLQGNIDPREKWSEARVADNLGRYLRLSRRAIEAGAEVVVWPESAVPGFIELDPTIRDPIAGLARESGVSFVLGATGADYEPVAQRFEAIYDSAFIMGPGGRLLDRYDKTQLVPFGEFVPFRALLGRFLTALARGLAPLDVSPGDAPRALYLPLAGHPEPIQVGVPICYELLFPDLVRRLPRDGATMLFAITNDAWYGRTGARPQFLAMTAVRSAETARYTLRVANSGVSAIIDPRGRIVQRSEMDVQDLLVGDIPLLAHGADPTFYVQHGDVFAWACALGIIGLFFSPPIGRTSPPRESANDADEEPTEEARQHE